MATFPLRSRPSLSYSTGGRKFGARRGDEGATLHAACDLIAPKGTEILAVASGVVTRGPYPFFHGTFAIEVDHSVYTARYCEIGSAAKGVSVGKTVEEGQVIAFVGKMFKDSMLHFEMYDNSETGQLTQKNKPPYYRREDLMDPTGFLDTCSCKGEE
jgi:murein DD-endopeptidase MepM/ murein hydrolase activator NlpD